MFKTGQRIKITKEARPYSHMGIVDHGTILPREVIFGTIKRVTGQTLSVEFEDYFAKRGRIKLDKLADFMTVEAA